jgi:hypothetical protein
VCWASREVGALLKAEADQLIALPAGESAREAGIEAEVSELLDLVLAGHHSTAASRRGRIVSLMMRSTSVAGIWFRRPTLQKATLPALIQFFTVPTLTLMRFANSDAVNRAGWLVAGSGLIWLSLCSLLSLSNRSVH